MSSCPLGLCPPLSVCPKGPVLQSCAPQAFPIGRLAHGFTCDVCEHRCPCRCVNCLKCVLKCVCYLPEPHDVQPDGWSASEDIKMFEAFLMISTALPHWDPRPLQHERAFNALVKRAEGRAEIIRDAGDVARRRQADRVEMNSSVTKRSKARRRKIALRTDHDSC